MSPSSAVAWNAPGLRWDWSLNLSSTSGEVTELEEPIIFGMGIIALVFVPVLTLEGIEGKLFRPMAWTFIFALLGALVTAVFLSPVLSYYFLSRRPPKKKGVVARKLTDLYGRAVGAALAATAVILKRKAKR